MEQLNIGRISRKTGRKAKSNVSKDAHGFEDIEEFFIPTSESSESEADQASNLTSITPPPALASSWGRNSPTNKIKTTPLSKVGGRTSLPKANSLRSPLPQTKKASALVEDTEDESQQPEFVDDDDMFNMNESMSPINLQKDSPDKNRYLQNLEQLSPDFDADDQFVKSVTKRLANSNKKQAHKSKKAANTTKRIALNKNSRRKKLSDLSDNEDEDEDEDEEQDTQDSPKKTQKKKITTPSVNTQTRKIKSPTVNTQTSSQPLRRSSRKRVQCLKYWENEKIVYKPVPGENGETERKVDSVVTHTPSTGASQPRSKANPKTTSKPKARAKPKQIARRKIVIPDEESQDLSNEEVDPEVDGGEWLKDGKLNTFVYDGPGSDKKVPRTIAWAPGHEEYLPPFQENGDNFRISILFDQERDYAAVGIMELPIAGQKSLKTNGDMYFTFYVITGLVEITVSNTVFVVNKGCAFEVPMGNFYQLINKGKSLAKLIFMQAKYKDLNLEEGPETID
ncbi:Elongating spindles structural integrity regulating protein [Komagataella phaffii CBS 7435]|uniref:Elongating spindles structural integrity regulating protein n=1 Tax=Komagataella phaffii (strain ATCC 76273 / CBS 7435 / CECT 11047 / NRRL Y-11430 / Wegner 21-1) TaxID=981350 RepID=F2QMM3_KOMPC|nr:GQ67_02948T0 [Komagataella phaffii]AOA66704.1 GQ68_02299T0 [Komagataella phaffii GS115]CAH2446535.1 Elongating spindles structural integrity regulating protein [Komagataella phaffii CBS 7435]CCA36828.1 Elongating spindles structural integrity regulating protein [Komagataella phaffii CBS 7435]